MNVFVYTPVARHYELNGMSRDRAIQVARESDGDLGVTVVAEHGHPPQITYPASIILYKYRKAQAEFLRSSCDVLLTIEDDMIVPPKTILQLLESLYKYDIVHGLYCFRTIGDYPWCSYPELSQSTSTRPNDPKYRARFEQAFRDEALVQVQGVGLGCTMIRRRVVERINFTRRGPTDCDWYFALDANELGFRTAADMRVRCGHMTTEPDCRTIWPDVTGDKRMYRIEYPEAVA